MSKPGGDDQMWLELLREKLDASWPYDLLNDRAVRQAMRELIKRQVGNVSRPELAAQVFCFAAALERERARAMVLLGTWPVHDEPSAMLMEELVVEVADEAA